MKRFAIVCSYLLLAACYQVSAAGVQPRTEWTANWISHPSASLREPGVLHFRKSFVLDVRPDRFMVHVSADNRFVLFVNGKRVGEGPARSDLHHWRYETFDLAPFLARGKNLIAATIWQFGIYAPIAQMTDRLAFLVEGDTKAEAVVNTDSSWEVEQENGHTPIAPLPEGLWFYYAAGAGERIDGNLYDWDWMNPMGSTGHWVKAGPAMRESIFPTGSRPVAAGVGGDSEWWLEPDPLPAMEYKEVDPGHVVRSRFRESLFPKGSLNLPANSDVAVLLDAGVVLSAYPELIVSGGKGSRVQVVYTEALYDSKQLRGNRNEVGDRVALGLEDEFFPDGGENRSFKPLWWRTWRYVELRIHTSDAPLRLDGFHAFYTAYPFIEQGEFSSSDPQLEKIREICWRTARVDAHETYMDTAYWEQLQYIGDTRIQALISYVVSGDDRLARQALVAFDRSRVPEGITQSRYPGSLQQMIPPFSLLYVDMLHDYWMYRPDVDFVKQLLPGTRSVMAWFERRLRSDGFLGKVPYWNFVDTPAGIKEFPPIDEEGRSSILTLMFIHALQEAADMEERFGDASVASRYRKEGDAASKAVYSSCWNGERGLLADTPARNSYSQHANILAVIADVIPKDDQAAVSRRVLREPGLAQSSYFFQFYLTRALDHAGLGDMYLETLGPWRQMLDRGLTTTPEYPDPGRSDTHAWSAHPAYDLATMVAGIRPDSGGFSRVRIEPHLGNLKSVHASMPHPSGMIIVSFSRRGESLSGEIDLPEGISGVLRWNSIDHDLHPGRQEIEVR